MRAWEDDEMKVDVRVDSEIGRKAREEVDRWRHETLVTQATRALGTAEAESYAVVTGSAEALGKQSMMTDLGMSAGRTPTQPRRLGQEEALGRPDMWN